MQQNQNDCFLCENFLYPLYYTQPYLPDEGFSFKFNSKPIVMSARISHSLYWKYSQSTVYYYTQSIDKVIANSRDAKIIKLNDDLIYHDEFEFLRRFYDQSESHRKVTIVTEFYKYHQDIPRWGLNAVLIKLMDEYYDGQRKLTYYRIQNIVSQQNLDNPDKPPKNIVGLKPRPSFSQSEEIASSGDIENQSHFITDFINEQQIGNLASEHKKLKTQYTHEMSDYGSLPMIFQNNTSEKNMIKNSNLVPKLPLNLIRKSQSPTKGLKINKWDLGMLRLTLFEQQHSTPEKQFSQLSAKHKQSIRSSPKQQRLRNQKNQQTLKTTDDACSKFSTARIPQTQKMVIQEENNRQKKTLFRTNQKHALTTRTNRNVQSPPKSSLANSTSPEIQQRILNFKNSLKLVNIHALNKLFKNNQQGLYRLWKKNSKDKPIAKTPRSYLQPQSPKKYTYSNPITSRTQQNDNNHTQSMFPFLPRHPEPNTQQSLRILKKSVKVSPSKIKVSLKFVNKLSINRDKYGNYNSPPRTTRDNRTKKSNTNSFSFKFINSKRHSQQIYQSRPLTEKAQVKKKQQVV